MILYLNTSFDNLDGSTLATLFIAFQEAFGKMCHEKLSEKLHSHGVRELL